MNTTRIQDFQSQAAPSASDADTDGEGQERLAMPINRYRPLEHDPGLPARSALRQALRATLAVLVAAGSAACVHNPAMPQASTVQGNAAGPVTGSASGATSVDSQVERCKETLGTLAIDDGRQQNWWGEFQRTTQITTLEPMIRLVVQQSNCFMITTAGNAELDAKTEALMKRQRSNEYRMGSNLGPNQKVASDFFLKPDIILRESQNNSQSGALNRVFGLPVSIAGGFSSSSAQVTLSLVNLRAGVVLAGSEGSATSSRFNATVAGFGVLGQDAAIGGMSRTPQGQATLAAFVDAYNKMVVGLRHYKAQTIRGGAGTGGQLKVQGQ